jgi:glutamyl-Q tRNA(Asp) synthetase
MDQTHACRFAPSPNGYLHLGHAYSAIHASDTARELGGQFLVRIEDIDTARSRDAFIDAIFEDLAWLGLSWQQPVLRQSHHFARYREAADRLAARGLLYPAFATRSEIAGSVDATTPRDPDGAPLYPAFDKRLDPKDVASRIASGEPYALRLDMERALAEARRNLGGTPLTFCEFDDQGARTVIEATPEIWGDAILVRKDTPASYHLAVVVDDAYQGITRVTRGRDLYEATHLHRLLQVLLDLPEPQFCHHRLVTGPDGRKLAKSAGDTSLRVLRSEGATPADIRRMLQLNVHGESL